MRSDDQNLIKYLFGDNRQIKVKLVFGTTDTITSVQSLDIDTDFGNTIAIGNTVSTSVKVTCETPSFSLRDKEFTLFFGVILSGTTVTWTKMGKFRIMPEDIENRLGFSTFTAYDKMYYKTRDIYQSNLSYDENTTMNQILAEIGQKCGLSVPDLTQGAYVNPAVPNDYLSEYTLRDALGYIASYQGKNAYIDCDGDTVVFKWFTQCSYNVDGHQANVPYADEQNVLIKKLIASTGEENIMVGTGSDALVFDNPLMTGERLEEMLPDFENFTYRRLDADIPVGNYLLEPWDILHISYIENPMDPVNEQTTITYTAPAMSLSFHYDGGLSCKVSSHGAPDSVLKSISARKFTDHTKFNGLQKEIVHATEQITGASGGYVRINFGDDGKTAEILILDKPEIDNPDPTKNAQNVWRWNQGGLAHSSNGYNGPYDDAAITKDGHISAKFISGDLISGVGIRTLADAEGKSHLDMYEGQLSFYVNTKYNDDGSIKSRDKIGGVYTFKDDQGRDGLSMWCPTDCWFDWGNYEKHYMKIMPYNEEIASYAHTFTIYGYKNSPYSAQRWDVAEYLYNANTNIDALKTRIEALESRMTNVEGMFRLVEKEK